jgi:hypothetical protein
LFGQLMDLLLEIVVGNGFGIIRIEIEQTNIFLPQKLIKLGIDSGQIR